MTNQESFDKWVSQFDTTGDRYLDMGADEYFAAGYESRQPEIDTLRSDLSVEKDFVRFYKEAHRLEEEISNALKAEVDHWKANHQNMVNRSRVLIDRSDLPLERVKAFEQIGIYQQENENLRKDAERYRWLRGENCEPFVEDEQTAFSVCIETEFDRKRKWVGRDLDSVIDAAMTAPDTKGE